MAKARRIEITAPKPTIILKHITTNLLIQQYIIIKSTNINIKFILIDFTMDDIYTLIVKKS
jgi:hypothetical protein